MHFRIRRNVVQLIRTTYDESRKKGKTTVVGTVRLEKPELTDSLRQELTAEEVDGFQAWIRTQHHATTLREELAALTLAETMERAANWFHRQGNTEVARTAAAEINSHWQSLRRTFKKNDLLD